MLFLTNRKTNDMNEKEMVQQLRKLLQNHGVLDDVRKLAQEKGLIPKTKPTLKNSRGLADNLDELLTQTAQTAKEQDDNYDPLVFQVIGVTRGGAKERHVHIEGGKPQTLAMLSSVLIESLSKEELHMFIAGLIFFADQKE